MEPCRFDTGCWRPLCPYGHSGRRAARWAALWAFLAMQEEEEVFEGPENIPKKGIHERIVEQTVDVPVPHVELATSSGEVDATSADVTAAAKPAGEARPPEFVEHSATSESDLVLAGREEEGVVKPGEEVNLLANTHGFESVHGESVHCGNDQRVDQACLGDNIGLNIKGSRQEQHTSTWRCYGEHSVL